MVFSVDVNIQVSFGTELPVTKVALVVGYLQVNGFQVVEQAELGHEVLGTEGAGGSSACLVDPAKCHQR